MEEREPGEGRLTVDEGVYEGAFGTPKTSAGLRRVPLFEATVRFLTEWKGRAKNTQPDALVFATWSGKPISPNNVLRRVGVSSVRRSTCRTRHGLERRIACAILFSHSAAAETGLNLVRPEAFVSTSLSNPARRSDGSAAREHLCPTSSDGLPKHADAHVGQRECDSTDRGEHHLAIL